MIPSSALVAQSTPSPLVTPTPKFSEAFLANLTLEDLGSALESQARVELARKCAAVGDVLGWGAALLPEKFLLEFCELHRYIVERRLDEFFALEAPRGHAKTTCACMLVPLYQALVEPETFRHYLQVQATDDKAMSVNNSIKIELEQNQLLQLAYGDQVGRDRWTIGQFVLKNGVCFTAVGAGQSIRGINYRNHRPDFIMLDDFYNEDDVNNVESTLKKNAWFWSTLYPARAKGRKSCVRVTGTPANNEDVLEKLKKTEGWSHKTFRAAEDIETGPVLWPELNTLENLQRDFKSMPITIFYRELMCERRDDASSIIKREWLEGWEYDPADLRFSGDFMYLGATLGIDPSIGRREEADYTAYALVIKAQRSDGSLPVYYIEALANEHYALQQRLDKAVEMTRGRPHDRPLTMARVEGISGFADFGDLVAARISVPCETIKHVPDKITHLEKKSAYFSNRRIFINKNIDSHLRDMLVQQLVTNHPKHDDLRDALLHALEDESSNWQAAYS